jgi:hypothetical protein
LPRLQTFNAPSLSLVVRQATWLMYAAK